MLRFILLICLTAFVATAPVFAHPEKDAPVTGVEIGTLFGLSHFPSRELTIIGVPDPLVFSFTFATPSLYVSWFPSERLALGSEFSFGRSKDDHGVETTTLYFGVRGTFFLRSNAVSGPYTLLNGALLSLYEAIPFEGYGSSFEHRFYAGVGLGYQWRVGPAFVLRTEGRYRTRMFNRPGVDEFSLFLGLGTRMGATAPVSVHLGTGIEIGTLFGLSRSPSYETIHIGVPSTISTIVPPGIPSLYVSWFLSERLALGSEFSFGRFSVNDEGDDEDDDAYGFMTLYLGGRGTFFLQSNAVSGPYLLGNGALMNLHLLGDEDDPYNVPHTYFSAGAGLGYQQRVGPDFVLRTEGRYRMWFLDEEFPLIADGTNEFSLFIGLGTRLGGK